MMVGLGIDEIVACQGSEGWVSVGTRVSIIYIWSLNLQ